MKIILFMTMNGEIKLHDNTDIAAILYKVNYKCIVLKNDLTYISKLPSEFPLAFLTLHLSVG